MTNTIGFHKTVAKARNNANFQVVRATLTELHRNTAALIRPVISTGQKLTITDRGEEVVEIVRSRKFDRKKALQALRRIGPLDIT